MNFLYINSKNIYPEDRHLIDGLRENGHSVTELNEDSIGYKKYFQLAKKIRDDNNNYDATIIGFTSPIFAIVSSLVSKNKTIFNAGVSQYEANVISRGINGFLFLSRIKWWLVDFISFHLSSFVLLESNAQIEFINKLYFLPKGKMMREWAGVNEKEFFYDSTIKKSETFTVLFRGRFLPESGILTVIEAAKKLEEENIKFLIIGHGFMNKEVNYLMNKLKPQNIEKIEVRLDIKDLRKKMLESHISLGQLANHERLDRTLPCKLFESLALRLPYLTGRNSGVLELLKEDVTCFAVKPGDSDDLVKKIIFLKNNPTILENVAENGYNLYKKNLTSKKLAQDFIEALIR